MLFPVGSRWLAAILALTFCTSASAGDVLFENVQNLRREKRHSFRSVECADQGQPHRAYFHGTDSGPQTLSVLQETGIR